MSTESSTTSADNANPPKIVSLNEALFTPHHHMNYFQFLWHASKSMFEGSMLYWMWVTVLFGVALVGLNTWAQQVVVGMGITGMSDHVSWGLYIANFTFVVGVAAAAVMMVIPAYLYHNRDMHDTVIVGELLAIAAVVMCLLSVTVDLGRPDRFWHMMPFIGKFNWPISMLSWDVIVLNGYLVINLHICGYLLYKRFLGQRPQRRWYLPFVFLSIIWAVSIHSVTAFLYCGLGGRPFWNTALLAPRFLASAFVAGPAFIIVSLMVLRRFGAYPFAESPIHFLVRVVRITSLINLFMLFSEIFTVFYAGSSHMAALQYLLFGLHGYHALVPWFWTAIAFNLIGTAIFLFPSSLKKPMLLGVACMLLFVGIWIEKGMGLIIPGFIPSTLHEMVEYVPTLAEWKITAGVWGAGLLTFTCLLKIALPILSGWTPGIAIGHVHIDDQHRELFIRMNDVVKKLRMEPNKENVQKSLAFLNDYTNEHFRDEEALMEEIAYPDIDQHKEQHAIFEQKIADISKQLETHVGSYLGMAEEIHGPLRAWLLAHIVQIDTKYGDYMAECAANSDTAGTAAKSIPEA